MGIGEPDWPLVGRNEELEFLRHQRVKRSSTIVSGLPGVGKSRLARSALSEADKDGWATLTIRGSAGLAGVPLGPLRSVLGVTSSSDVADLVDSVVREFAAMRSEVGLMVLAEDGHDLDDTTAALLHQQVSAGAIVAVITMRSGTPHPDALTAIWKDELGGRIDLQDLSRFETTELLVGVLGTRVEDSTAHRIWQVTAGNPLYIREVVLASSETGALKEVDQEWRWRGEWASDARLQEIVASRLGRLDPDELTAIEMLALAGSLPLRLIAGLATAKAIEGLEERGLVTLTRQDRRQEVTIAHQLHAEVMRSGIPLLRQRAIRRNLVDALNLTEHRRVADRVRLACWSLEAGVEVDPVTLALGADASLFQIGHAISARLDEILPESPIAHLVPAAPAVPEDAALAVRLAQALYDRIGGIEEGATLVRTLAWTGATANAEAVLSELSARVADIDDRVRLGIALAWIRFWARHDAEGAVAVLLESAEAAKESATPALLANVYEQLAGVELNTGHPAKALDYSQLAAEAEGLEVSETIAAPPAAASLAYLGRCDEAVALADRAVPAAIDRGSNPLTVPNLLFARAGALARKGRLVEALDLVEACRGVALSSGSSEGTSLFGVLAGELLLRQGRPASAGRMFRDAAGLFVEHDMLGYRPWALTGLARARAQIGDEDGAFAALAEAHRVQGMPRHYEMSRYLAEVAVHTLARHSAAARDVAQEGAAWARGAGMVVDEALALHAWILIEPNPAVDQRMTELAALTDSNLVAAFGEHARALVDSDPVSLVNAGHHFAAMSAWWMAAEATAAAVRLYEQRNEPRAAKAASRSALSFAEHCEGSRSIVVDSLTAPRQLTIRELEIAQLVTAGRSNQEIATRLFLSRRTVESHIYHICVKLGVSGRSDLAGALDAASPNQ